MSLTSDYWKSKPSFVPYTICRLCLNSNESGLHNIFDKDNESIYRKIQKCLPTISLQEIDLKPKYICGSCLSKLDECAAFIDKCLDSDAKFTQLLIAHSIPAPQSSHPEYWSQQDAIKMHSTGQLGSVNSRPSHMANDQHQQSQAHQQSQHHHSISAMQHQNRQQQQHQYACQYQTVTGQGDSSKNVNTNAPSNQEEFSLLELKSVEKNAHSSLSAKPQQQTTSDQYPEDMSNKNMRAAHSMHNYQNLTTNINRLNGAMAPTSYDFKNAYLNTTQNIMNNVNPLYKSLDGDSLLANNPIRFDVVDENVFGNYFYPKAANGILNHAAAVNAVMPPVNTRHVAAHGASVGANVGVSDKSSTATHGIGSSTDVMAHRQQGEEERMKELTCTVCGKVFSRKNRLQAHMARHSSIRPHQCDKCTMNFLTRWDLTLHSRIHSGIFSCEFCGKAFPAKGKLERHRRTHTGERPYPCTKCTKSFSEKRNLENHLKTHLSDKPFVCTMCSNSFYLREEEIPLVLNLQELKCSSCEQSMASDLTMKPERLTSNVSNTANNNNNNFEVSDLTNKNRRS